MASLHGKSEQIQTELVRELITNRTAYGPTLSLSLQTRPPGYHTTPHLHYPELYGYVISGEMWIFIEDKGYLLRAGDFVRVPRNANHWAWNRGSEAFTWLIALVPGRRMEGQENPWPLFDEDEAVERQEDMKLYWLDPEVYKAKEIEEALINGGTELP